MYPPASLSLRSICLLLLMAVVLWLALDTAQQGTRQLVSFFGLLLLIFLMLLFSKHPFRVRDKTNTHKSTPTLLMNCFLVMTTCSCLLQWSWQTLLCGIGLQFFFGLLILRTTYGLGILQWLGTLIEVHTSCSFLIAFLLFSPFSLTQVLLLWTTLLYGHLLVFTYTAHVLFLCASIFCSFSINLYSCFHFISCTFLCTFSLSLHLFFSHSMYICGTLDFLLPIFSFLSL